jgi:hypothetical protein
MMTDKQSPWLPIESAPKDGTRVRLWGSIEGEIWSEYSEPSEPTEVTGRWEFLSISPLPEDHEADHWAHPSGWYVWPTCYYDIRVYPTHWQPLSEPPKEVAP